MPLISTQEAADILGVSRRTILRWIEDGRLEARTEGFQKYLDGDEIQAYARQNAADTIHRGDQP